MCGIVGYVGDRKTTEILLEGLNKLEYRGYDSSGIAIKSQDNIQIIKSEGKISDLEKKVENSSLIESKLGIAHTRWATHGEANETNAHPHQFGKVTIVHNGIIENERELKEELINKNLIFKGETDTEVAAAVINNCYKKDPIEAITKAMELLNGSYAFGIIFNDQNKLYAVRKDSPLIVGIGTHENFIASDIATL